MQQKNNANKQTKDTLIYSTIVSFILFALFVIFFPNINLDIKQPNQGESFAVLNNTTNLNEIFDDEPLFIPTKWNSTSSQTDIANPIGWDTLVKKSEKIATPILSIDFLIDQDADFAHARSELSQSFRRNIFSSYKYEENFTEAKAFTNHITFNLIDLSTGKTILTKTIANTSDDDIYSIAEFKITIGNDDWAMQPLKIHSSGNDKIDSYIEKELTSSNLLKGVKQGDYKAVFTP